MYTVILDVVQPIKVMYFKIIIEIVMKNYIINNHDTKLIVTSNL